MPMSLKDIIAAQGRRQNWVAEQLGIPEGAFSKMVRGMQQVPARKIEPLAQLLGVPLVDVLHAIAPPSGKKP